MGRIKSKSNRRNRIPAFAHGNQIADTDQSRGQRSIPVHCYTSKHGGEHCYAVIGCTGPAVGGEGACVTTLPSGDGRNEHLRGALGALNAQGIIPREAWLFDKLTPDLLAVLADPAFDDMQAFLFSTEGHAWMAQHFSIVDPTAL